jgi:glycosyltransferase involved in cell wall biosynthesis
MDFISLSLNHWEDLWQSRHQIMWRIAQDHKVLFVSPPFSFAQVVADRKKKNLPPSGVIHRGAGLYTLVFPKWMFELFGYPRLERIMAYLRAQYIRRMAKKLQLRDTTLFVWHPYFSGFVGVLGAAVTCYYVDDEFASYPDQSESERIALRQREDELMRRVDQLFVNGPALMAIKNRYGNGINVPMSADFELFSMASKPGTKVPADLAAIPSPRIGYVGNVNDKVDFGLLSELATRRPDWSIVLVGPVNARSHSDEFERLRQFPNVFILGAKPRESLPQYNKGLDVCLMCYRMDGWAYYIYPLKLHEYLASGKPVVGSPLVSLQEFDGVIRIARNAEEWLEHIDAAVRDRDESLAAKRIQTAYENRSEERVRVILQALQRKLEERKLRSTAMSVS